MERACLWSIYIVNRAILLREREGGPGRKSEGG